MNDNSPPGVTASALYASGSLGTGVFSTVPTVLLLFFCTEIVHIPAAWAAAAVFVPKAWAIVWDPLVGSWSDGMRSRFGRRRPFLALGLLGITVFFVAVFTLPPLPVPQAFAWVAVAYFGLATTYSLFAVPYIAIPAEIGTSAPTRARLVSWRMTIGMIGVLTGAGIAPLLVAYGGGGRHGYAFMSLCIALVCAIAMLGPIAMMTRRDKRAEDLPPPSHAAGWSQLRQALRHGRFSALTASYMIQLTAVGMITSSAPYLVTRAFGHSEGDVGTAMLTMLGATTACVPIWTWLGRRFSERRALAAAVLLFGIAASLLSIMAMIGMSWPIALAGFALVGLPFAGMQVLPFTIAAHLVHAANTTISSSEGSYTGIWTAAEKLGLAMGPALTGLVLAVTHENVANGLTRYLVVIPFLLAVSSLPLIRSTVEPQGQV